MIDQATDSGNDECTCGICVASTMSCRCELCRLERSEGWAVIGLGHGDAGDIDEEKEFGQPNSLGHGDAGDSEEKRVTTCYSFQGDDIDEARE